MRATIITLETISKATKSANTQLQATILHIMRPLLETLAPHMSFISCRQPYVAKPRRRIAVKLYIAGEGHHIGPRARFPIDLGGASLYKRPG